MTAPLPTLESPEPLAGQSLGAAPGSAIARAIDAMQTTRRLHNLGDGHCLSSACRALEQHADRRDAIADAAAELCSFTRLNEYPEKMTPEFFRLTELLDRLNTELARAGIIAKTLSPNVRVSESGGDKPKP